MEWRLVAWFLGWGLIGEILLFSTPLFGLDYRAAKAIALLITSAGMAVLSFFAVRRFANRNAKPS